MKRKPFPEVAQPITRRLAALTVGLLTFLALLVSCGDNRSSLEQQWYDTGYEFADGVIEVDGVTDRGEIMDECALKASLLDLQPGGEEESGLMDGCYDRGFEEDPWD